MPKRKRSGEPAQKRHLYLLLDDWDSGYSVRKVDVAAFRNNDDLPPPPPPVVRIEAPHVRSWNFVSHGSKIFAMKAREGSPAVPVLDTRMMSLAICPLPSCRGDYAVPLFASVGGKLFLFWEDGTEYLLDPPPPKAPWSWSTINDSPPPFYTMQIACYALHPDGRTLFVSAAGSRRRKNRPGTFSFDAERLEWTHHGDWLLPFEGQAYFDAELEAWVGLARGGDDSAGRLCSCDLIPVGGAKLTSAPSCKVGVDKMFHKEAHRGAKLIYMGDSNFCLVESLFHLKNDDDPAAEQRRRRQVLRMTTFGLKYNKAGNLKMKLRQAHASMVFERPHDFTQLSLEPLAFWM